MFQYKVSCCPDVLCKSQSIPISQGGLKSNLFSGFKPKLALLFGIFENGCIYFIDPKEVIPEKKITTTQ